MARLRRAFFQAMVRRTGQETSLVPVWPLPYTFGRAATDSYHDEIPGVWERHLVVGFEDSEGFVAEVREGAVATVEGRPFQRHRIRNGDQLQLGALSVQFFVAPVPRKSLGAWEAMFWLLFGAMGLVQVLILARLLSDG